MRRFTGQDHGIEKTVAVFDECHLMTSLTKVEINDLVFSLWTV